MSRTRKSIPIRGINTSEPCMTVADGFCEDIYNMRFRNGALSTVKKPTVIASYTDRNGFTILGTTPMLTTGRYIAVTDVYSRTMSGQGTQWVATIHEVGIENGIITSKNNIVLLVSNVPFTADQVSMFVFGNVLYFQYGSSSVQLLCKEGVYTEVNMDSLTPPVMTISTEHRRLKSAVPDQPGVGLALEYTYVAKYCMAGGVNDATTHVASKEFFYNTCLGELTSDNFIVGLVKLRVAYKMMDGSIIKSSAPIMVKSYLENPTGELAGDGSSIVWKARYWEDGNKTYELYYFHDIHGVRITLNVKVPDGINSDLVKSVVILSTRVEPMYDYDNIHEKFDASNDSHEGNRNIIWYKGYSGKLLRTEELCDNNDIYYEVEELALDAAMKSAAGKSVQMKYEKHFKDIASSPTVGASVAYSNISGSGCFEYNGSMHLYGVTACLNNGFDFTMCNDYSPQDDNKSLFPQQCTWSDQYAQVSIETEIEIDNSTYRVVKNKSNVRLVNGPTGYLCLPIANLVTYPDARARRMTLRVQGENVNNSFTFALKEDKANNMAFYYMNKLSLTTFALPVVSIYNDEGQMLPSEQKITVSQPNKLYVSALNNPFYFPVANIYAIGNQSTVIDGVESAADQITETKFGMYPLYVFTNEGTYALEVGEGDVLYRSVIAINNERKVFGSNTISALGRVFYVGERGVMALQGRNLECISTALETFEPCPRYDPARTPFELYLRDSDLMYNPIEREVILYNKAYEYAYIFDLESKQWARREWRWVVINGRGEAVGGGQICDFWHENQVSGTCSITTRALKLDSLEFKRLETMILRNQMGASSSVVLILEGSNDLSVLVSLRRVTGGLVRRTTSSYRYFRLRADFRCGSQVAITHIDAEFYLRFVDRLG